MLDAAIRMVAAPLIVGVATAGAGACSAGSSEDAVSQVVIEVTVDVCSDGSSCFVAAVPSATVIVEGTLRSTSFRTDAAGKVTVARLDPGLYTIRATWGRERSRATALSVGRGAQSVAIRFDDPAQTRGALRAS